MNKELVSFIESSKISPLLLNPSITDVSFNGTSIFYQDNIKGRKKSDIKLSVDEATAFIRQIANLSEKQFSYTNPILDISIKNYRINAVHSSIVRNKDDKGISFAIRVGSFTSRIEHDRAFMNASVRKLLKKTLEKEESIIIAGKTGTGKTELQKYLLMNLKPYSRIIIIDNIQELDAIRLNEDLDVTSWQLNPNIQDGTFERLIQNALRSNPDWLVIAESRGKEMNDVLNSVITGHPVISTIHAKDIESIPSRITRMVEMSDSTQKYDDIYQDVLSHFPCYILLEKRIDRRGNVHRFIKEIAKSDGKKLNTIYRKEDKK